MHGTLDFWKSRRMRSKRFVVAVLVAIVFVSGCLRKPSKPTPRARIVSALVSRNVNNTYVALWTLEEKGFAVPEVDFARPFSRVQAELEKLAEAVEVLPPVKQAELDESFKSKLAIHSPFDPFHAGEGWEP